VTAGRVKPLTRLVTATAVKTGSTTTAVIDGVTTTVQVARDLTVAAGDVLLVHLHGSAWFASSRHWSAAPAEVDNDTAPNPKPSIVSGTLTITPVSTGSYLAGRGWRTSDDNVRQGQYGGTGLYTGAAFYGTKPRSLTGAVVTAASVAVRRETSPSFGAQTTTLRLITETSRPAGAPTLTSTTTGPSLTVGQTDTAFTVPTSWAQALVDGTAGGLGIYDGDGSPYVVLAGRGAWSPAFTLRITWQRS
jgi:hypothetical protein